MTECIIGIDPGVRGGIGFLSIKGEMIEAIKMPREFDLEEILRGVINGRKLEVAEAWIELPFIASGGNTKSIFNILVKYGVYLKTLHVLGIHYVEVNPREWKSAFKLDKDKKKSMDLSEILFPDSKKYIWGDRGGMNDGVAEALLIAEYGRQKYNKKLWSHL